MSGHFEAGVTPRISSNCAPPTRPYTQAEVNAGRSPPAGIDVTGVSKGKGTAGVMKRHGFHGLRASTVCTASTVRPLHRAVPTPARIFPGMKMAGGWASKVTVRT